MGIHAVDKMIDGHKVNITTFGGVDGVVYKLKLLRLIGPSLLSMLPETTGNTKNLTNSLLKVDVSMKQVSLAINSLFTSLDSEGTVQFIQDLVKLVYVDGVPLSSREAFDGTFADDYILLYKILYAVIEVNYGKLLAKGNIGSILKNLKDTQPILPKNMEK